MEKVDNVLMVLANPSSEEERFGMVSKLCKKYGEVCQKTGLSVDLIDLYKDAEIGEFNPLYYYGERDTKVLEYQLRIKKSDMIVFFYPVWWNSMPAILKGFLEKVFVSGFAYQKIKGKMEGLLGEKKASVFVFDERSALESKLFHNNNVKTFWQRGVFETCNLKGKINLFTGLKVYNDKEFKKLEKEIIKSVEKINKKKGSVFDLL